jgi:hypothetical protein
MFAEMVAPMQKYGIAILLRGQANSTRFHTGPPFLRISRGQSWCLLALAGGLGRPGFPPRRTSPRPALGRLVASSSQPVRRGDVAKHGCGQVVTCDM